MSHAHLEDRKSSQPRDVKIMHEQALSFNEKVIVFVAGLLGSPWTFYVFCILALISAPQVFASESIVTIISWITQTFIQLVALAVLQAFQTITGKKLDKMLLEMYRNSKLAYRDAEVLLKLTSEVHELLSINNDLIHYYLINHACPSTKNPPSVTSKPKPKAIKPSPSRNAPRSLRKP